MERKKKRGNKKAAGQSGRSKKVGAAVAAFIGLSVLCGFVSVGLVTKHTGIENNSPSPQGKLVQDIWPVLYDVDYNKYLLDEAAQESENLNSEEPSAKEEPKRTLSPVSIPYDGRERAISCWGDSMMYGCATTPGFITLSGVTQNISYATAPGILAQLTGLTVYNLGVNGETSREIALRQGGLMMVTDRDIDIDGTGIAEFKLKCLADGETVYMEDYSGYNFQSHVNICVMNGEQYYVTNGYDEETQLIYGTDVHIEAGTPVYTLAAVERRDDILILEIGSNGGWDNDYDTLIAQYDAMIESTGCRYYIIVGDTDDPELSADIYRTEVGTGETPWEKALEEAYGEHFFNLRRFMIQNGLQLCGLETTEEDIDGFLAGRISRQLRSDWTHFNAYGYYAKAKGLYQKGQDLGYWQ